MLVPFNFSWVSHFNCLIKLILMLIKEKKKVLQNHSLAGDRLVRQNDNILPTCLTKTKFHNLRNLDKNLEFQHEPH